MLHFGLALILAAPPQADGEPTRVCDAAVRSDELDYREFQRDAQLRLPQLSLREVGSEPDPACAGQLHAFVELRPRSAELPGRSGELSVILSDGRAWFRPVDAPPDQAARTLASTLANLLAAIEDDALAPDLEDVALPDAIVERAPSEDQDGDPSQTSDEVSSPEASGRNEEAAEPAASPQPIELGVRALGAGAIGVAPAPSLRGLGGGVGLDLRLASGLSVALDLRLLGQSRAPLGLLRTRVGLGVGYTYRAPRLFELPVIASFAVEPWTVREAGARVPLGAPPLLGAGLRVAPSVVVPTGPVALRVGLGLGLDASFEAAAGGRTPAIAVTEDEPAALRVGGLEFVVGLELGVWIPVARRRR